MCRSNLPNSAFYKVVVLVFAFLTVSQTLAMDGVFDRSAEVEKYIAIMKTGAQGAAADAAKEIYRSGISDRQLADAINARLLADYAGLQPSKAGSAPGMVGDILQATTRSTDDGYGILMIEALQSFGLDDYNATFEKIKQKPKQGGAISKPMRSAANKALHRIDWHRSVDEEMASMKNHHEGDDPKVSRLINLLQSNDATHRKLAFTIIKIDKITDQRIYSTLQAQITQYLSSIQQEQQPKADRYIAYSVRLLGLSGNAQYAPTLEAVVNSNAPAGLKRYAEVARNQLQ